MLKTLLYNWFNVTSRKYAWELEKQIGGQLVRIEILTSRNFQLNVEKHTLQKENDDLRKQAEEAVKDMAIQTGEILSLKNQLAYCKAELSMKHYE